MVVSEKKNAEWEISLPVIQLLWMSGDTDTHRWWWWSGDRGDDDDDDNDDDDGSGGDIDGGEADDDGFGGAGSFSAFRFELERACEKLKRGYGNADDNHHNSSSNDLIQTSEIIFILLSNQVGLLMVMMAEMQKAT